MLTGPHVPDAERPCRDTGGERRGLCPTQGLPFSTWETPGKKLVKLGKRGKNLVFLEAEALTRNLGFLEDDDLRILGKCIGDH